MGHHHALGAAGRARGVDHVREVLGQAPRRRRLLAADAWRPGQFQADHAAGRRRQAAGEILAGDQHHGPRILEEEALPLERVLGIERHVGAARRQDAQHPDDHLRRALHRQADAHLGSDATAAELGGQHASLPLQLTVGEGDAACLERHRVRSPGRLGREQPVQGLGRRVLGAGAVALVQPPPFLRGEQLEGAERASRRAHRRAQQRQPPARHPLDLGPRPGAAVIVQRDGQLVTAPQTGQLQGETVAARREPCDRQHHLAGGVARRQLDGLEAEGEVGRRRRRRHAPIEVLLPPLELRDPHRGLLHEGEEGLGLRRLERERQITRQWTDGAAQLVVTAAAAGDAEDRRRREEALQQQVPGGEQHGRRAAGTRHRRHRRCRRCEAGWQRHLQHPRSKAPLGDLRLLVPGWLRRGWRGRESQAALPEPPALLAIRGLQELLLPGRDIGILHRRRGRARRGSAAQGRGRGELGDQGVDRRRIRAQRGQVEQQLVMRGAERHQGGPHHRSRRGCEGQGGHLPGQAGQRGGLLGGREGAEVVVPEDRLESGRHHLQGQVEAGDGPESGAQDLVALDQRRQRRGHRSRLQAALDADRRGDAVRRAAVAPLQLPEPALLR